MPNKSKIKPSKQKFTLYKYNVIIPAKNEDNLVLCEEVEEAIKNKKFHIYKVNKVEEAMEILTDEKFSIIKELSIKKLRKYSEYKK